jgi:uncharacterized membrane protein YdbT with pleckstrin-like domain
LDAEICTSTGRVGALLFSYTAKVCDMAYYTKVLQPNENVMYISKLHWIIYRHAILFGVLGFAALVVYFRLTDEEASVALIAAGCLLLVAVMSFIHRWFHRLGTEIVVTDKRVIHKTGWISRRTEEINITKVETVEVFQGILGRILGYGTVLIRGTGTTWEPLQQVASPLQLRNAIIVG